MLSNDARILRGAAIPSFGAGLLGTLIGGITVGAQGAIGGAVGTVLTLAFFGVG
ncbi:ATP synthase I, partial [Streptomyces sp. NRRL F-6602]